MFQIPEGGELLSMLESHGGQQRIDGQRWCFVDFTEFVMNGQTDAKKSCWICWPKKRSLIEFTEKKSEKIKYGPT